MTRLSAVLWERPRRTAILALAIAAGMLFIGILTLALPAGSPAAMLLLDHHANPPPGYPFVYPFTVQNLMHLLHLVQAREELAVNQAGHYTLVNLINRLSAGRSTRFR